MAKTIATVDLLATREATLDAVLLRNRHDPFEVRLRALQPNGDVVPPDERVSHALLVRYKGE